MFSPSLQLAQNLQGSAPLSQLGAGVTNIVQQKRQNDALKAQAEAYKGALGTYMQDKSPENRLALYDVTPPDRLESLDSTLKDMDTTQRANEIQSNMEVIASLTFGDDATAISKAKAKAEAARNSGNEQLANQWDMYATKIDAGEGDKVSGILQLMMGRDEVGGKALDTLWNQKSNKRDNLAQEKDILKAGSDIVFKDTAERAKWINELKAGGFSVEMVNKLASATKLLEELPPEAEYDKTELLAIKKDLASDYIAMTQEYREVGTAYNNVVSAANRGNDLETKLGEDDETGAIGVADQALVNAFIRMIDPGATVRETDIQAALKTAGWWDQASTGLKSIASGQKLNKKQRDEMIAIADLTKQASSGILDMAEQFIIPRLPEGIDASEIFIAREEIVPVEETSSPSTEKDTVYVDYLSKAKALYPNATADQLAKMEALTLEELQNKFGEWITD